MKEVIFNELSETPAIGSLPERVKAYVEKNILYIRVPVGVERARYVLDSSQEGIIIVLGEGDGDSIRSGAGMGHAGRQGSGSGCAVRSGEGSGDSFRLDDGDGDAIHLGPGKGKPYRAGDGRGYAKHTREASVF